MKSIIGLLLPFFHIVCLYIYHHYPIERNTHFMLLFLSWLCILPLVLGESISSSGGTRCSVDWDCRRLSSFCEGDFLCNTSSGWCIKKEASYDPCDTLRVAANAFYRETDQLVSLLCVETLKACVEVYYCLRDSDCDDGLYCNGQERCVSGQCVASASTRTPPCHHCDEVTQCGTTNSLKTLQTETLPPSDEANLTSVYTLVVGFTVVGAIVTLFLLAFICQQASKPTF